MNKAEFHAQLAIIAAEIPLHTLGKLNDLLFAHVETLMDIEPGTAVDIAKQMSAINTVNAIEQTIRNALEQK